MTAPISTSVKCVAVDLYSGDRVDDFSAAKDAGVELVILKASEGRTRRDATYQARRDAARKAGLLVAAYHFSYAGNVDAQVANFLAATSGDDDPELRFVLDWEDYADSWLSVAEARAFLAAVDAATGKRTVIYASDSFLKERLGAARDGEFASHPLWVAAYRNSALPPTPQASWPAPILWQYTDGTAGGFPRTIAGIPGNSIGQVDLNAAPGMTAEAFRAAWLGDTAAPAHPHDWSWSQAQLKALGLYTDTVDGDPGHNTEVAVAAFIEKYSPQRQGGVS